MKFLRETTIWGGTATNHTYVLTNDKSRMIGYVPSGKNAVFTFKNPIKISLSRRTFVEVKNTFGYTGPADGTPKWEVIGSKGDRYTVTKPDTGYVCSCSGFSFRGKCRHITQIQEIL